MLRRVGSTRIEVDREGAAAAVLRLLVDAGLTGISTSFPSLEDVYVRVIGEGALDAGEPPPDPRGRC